MKPLTNIHDFLQDKSFVEWVLKPNATSSDFWENMAADKDKAILINQAKRILLELDLPGSDWDVQDQRALLSKIHLRIRFNGLPVQKTFNPGLSLETNETKSVFRKRASTVLVVFFVSFMAFLALDVINTNDLEVQDKAEIALVWNTKFNPKGQKSKIHLPDGSTVIINADSEIRFRSDFGDTNRDIYLKGESFFEVAPDSLLPFRVFSEDIITTAIGTSFNINSYDPDHIQVQLATGKVEVMSDSQAIIPIFLQPGEELSVVGGQKMEKRKFNPKKAFLWKSGILLFDNASLTEFKVNLERWYGVEIEQINSPSSRLRISGEFKDTYLSNVLESVGYAYGFDYKIDQKKVKLVFTE